MEDAIAAITAVWVSLSLSMYVGLLQFQSKSPTKSQSQSERSERKQIPNTKRVVVCAGADKQSHVVFMSYSPKLIGSTPRQTLGHRFGVYKYTVYGILNTEYRGLILKSKMLISARAEAVHGEKALRC